MIKLYIDWNVISGMKNGYFFELSKILENKDKFLIIYSTAHIGDIHLSYSDDQHQKQIIEEDFDFITSLTENLCFFNNQKELNIDYINPKALLEDLIMSSDLMKDFSIDNLFKSFEFNDELTELLNDYKEKLKEIPLDKSFIDAFNNPNLSKMMKNLFPGLEENLSMDGFFKYFGKMYEDMNQGEYYKILRKAVQQDIINSGYFNENKHPFRLIEDVYKKKGIEMFDADKYFSSSKNTLGWDNEVIKAYQKLDIHGYKSDIIRVNNKTKKTFTNTYNDACHTAFASHCDFYITNDDKNYCKSKAVYEEFEISTTVLKPEEFINYYKENLTANNFHDHLYDVINTITKKEDFYEFKYSNANELYHAHCSKKYFFNFFNKVTIPAVNKDGLVYILTKEHPAKKYVVVHKELEKLIKVFADSLGKDDEEKSYYYVEGEIIGEDWNGRSWSFDKTSFKLKRVHGWFQLYFYFEEN